MIIEKPQYVQAQMNGNNFAVTLMPSVSIPSNTINENRFVDVIDVDRIIILFSIVIEERDWGIKNVMVSVNPSDASLNISVRESIENEIGTYTDTESATTIRFDPSKIELRLTTGGSVTISNFELALTTDFKVDYENSYFEGTSLIGSD